MAPSASASATTIHSKVKRPLGIQTNGLSGTSSPSPSISAGRLPPKQPSSASASSGVGNGPRSAKDRMKRDTASQLLGRGQRNSSAGLRSASLVGETALTPISEQPYVKSDTYILKKFRGNPPSLIIHLHPTNFRFDQQEGSFSYTSPMRIVLDHLRQRTVPHELLEFMPNVPFYEGCMIVQVHDHKTLATSAPTTKATPGLGASAAFSIHNANPCLTPSPYVKFEASTTTKKSEDVEGDDNKSKSTEQKDKENMPAPSLPNDNQRKQNGHVTKKIYSVVLRPTPLTNYMDLANKAAEARPGPDGRRESKQDTNGPLSATVPPTPTTAVPSTPIISMAPPAKRVKKSKLDHSNIYSAESQIMLATTSSLHLDPASCAAESACVLEALAHPMHAEKPPSPKTRKRTVAEMAADEAAAAEHERYMLYFDERLSGVAKGAQRSSNAAEGSGQAIGAPFEPRFERFQILETIKAQYELNKREEKLKKEESDKKQQQEQARNKLRDEAEKKEQDKIRLQMQAQSMQQRQAHQAEQRRVQVQQAQMNMQGALQGAHAHPQANGLIPNGMAAQSQRFHQQQAGQNSIASPIVRNGTPQSHSSPTVNNMGNVPMQQSTSSMGGSPARPGSVVHQNHPQIGVPAGHAMVARGSQQSHAGTPRMPPTPNVQSTPISRPMNQTPRMSQGSPLQGALAQTPQMPHQQMPMNNVPISQQQAQAFQNQQRMQMMMNQQRQQMAQQQANNTAGMMQNGTPLTPAQQQMLQVQMMREQQARQMQQQQQGGMQQGTAAYGAQLQQHMAALAARGGNMPGNVPQGMNQHMMANNPGMNMPSMPMTNTQMAQMQHMQQQQRAAQIQQQQQMQQQQQHQGGFQGQPQQMTPQAQMYRQQLMVAANQIYQNQRNAYLQTHPAGITADTDAQLKARSQQAAQAQMQQRVNQRRQEAMMAQQQQQQQQNQNMNAMQNGMGM